MQRILPRACIAAILFGFSGFVLADEPRQVIERAIKAMGADPLRDLSPAIHLKIKGKYYDMDGLSLTGEVWQQFPEQQKMTIRVRGAGQDFVMTLVLNRTTAWEAVNGETQVADPGTLVDLKEDSYRELVDSLLPLLRDKAFTVRSAGDKSVEGKPATVLAVQSKDHPEIRLYFDKGTGLLVKSEYRRRQGGKGAEILNESYFSDYREVLWPARDEKTLKNAQIATDGAGLIAFLGKHTLDDAARAGMLALIRKLGDSSFQTREKARDDLIAQGERAAPLLSQAVRDPDPEVASRARECLDKISKGQPQRAVLIAALRLLAQRRPDRATETLLSYLPCAPDETVAQAVQGALVAVALQNDAASRALLQAVQSKDPAQRRAAEIALGRHKSTGKDQPAYMLLLPGLKEAMKETSYRDGKKTADVEVLEYQLFTRLPDKEFAKP
jgi:HEAT repeat protein